MTETTSRPEIKDMPLDPEGPPQGGRQDRLLGLFLRIGVVVLVLAIGGFAFLYLKDQRITVAPSIVDQQIARAEAAVRENPNDVAARITLATMYQEAKRWDESIAQFDEVLKVSDDNQDGRMGKGYTLMTKGDLDAAIAEYTKVTEARRSGEFAGADTRLQAAYYYLGVIALKQGKPVPALEKLTLALQITPTDSDALYQYGLAQAELGKHAEAIVTFKKALTFVPTGWCDPYTQLQASYSALGQPEEASYADAMNLYCQHKVDQAKQQLNGLVEGPAAVDALLGLGLIAQIENDDKGAVAWYQKVLVKDPKNITAMSNLAALGVTPPQAASPTPSAPAAAKKSTAATPKK